jgi:hypothetical protein
MTTIPEMTTAQTSGNQDNSVTQPQPQATEQPTATATEPSYFDSEESISKKINELTNTAETGSNEEVAKAIEELSKIKEFLEEAKRQPQQPAPAAQPTATQQQEQPTTTPTDTGTPKKFTVTYNGQRIERDDPNSLLGYKSTGDLKAAHIKQGLQHEEEVKSLSERLRIAEEKIKAATTHVPLIPVQPQQQQQFQPPSKPVVQRPVPPPYPTLSTDDPDLYTEEDKQSIYSHQKKMVDFGIKVTEYAESMGNRTLQLDPATRKEIDELRERVKRADELIGTVEAEKKNLAEEKADNDHWQRFTDFQNKHDSFKMPLPTKKMNEVVNKWIGSIAVANGVNEIVNGQPNPNYAMQRANVIDKYLNGDPTVLQNSQGFQPPDGYEAYFKNLAVYNAWKKYKEDGVLKENATLEHAYALYKVDTGEMDEAIESIRTTERTKAVEEFANGVKEFQQTAVNINPSLSSGGPDFNSIGITEADAAWFMSIGPEKVHSMQTKNPKDFERYSAIAAKIMAKA